MPPRKRPLPETDDEDDEEEEQEEEEEAAFDEDAARRAAKRLKVAQLRAALEEMDETPDGGKAALVEQLVAAQRAAAEEGGGEEKDGGGDDDDGLDAWDDHDLMVAILRELRAQRELTNGSSSKHEFGSLAAEKRSTCGVCSAKGQRPRRSKFGCKTSQVRFCGWSCLNEHVRSGIGKKANKDLVFKIEPEGGQRVPGRSRFVERARLTVRVGGRGAR